MNTKDRDELKKFLENCVRDFEKEKIGLERDHYAAKKDLEDRKRNLKQLLKKVLD